MLAVAAALVLLPFTALAQYNAKVGPTTALASKTTVCNVLNYGGKADNATDIGPAIASAFSSCVVKTPGSRLYVPAGNYLLRSTQTLNAGTNWAFQLDGLITADYTGTISGNMLVIKRAQDFEFYSSNGKGAFQGQGYIWRLKDGTTASKPRILRCTDCTNYSIHDILLIDAPQFHLVLDNAVNAEIYYLTIRGPDIGGSDGIDVSGTNVYIHDVAVTNRDECVSVKSPANYMTIAKMRCNRSGGLSIGSLQSGASVQNIVFQDIENFQSTQGLMIKTYPGGTDPGFVKNIIAKNFHNIDTTYSAYITQYWQNKVTPDNTGVQISNVTFSNWTGSMDMGYQRGSVVLVGSNPAPMHDITVKDFNMWSKNLVGKVGDKPKCSNAYGTGSCAAKANGNSYPSGVASTITVTATPAGWTAPATPTWASTAGWGTFTSIPVYTPMPKYPF